MLLASRKWHVCRASSEWPNKPRPERERAREGEREKTQPPLSSSLLTVQLYCTQPVSTSWQRTCGASKVLHHSLYHGLKRNRGHCNGSQKLEKYLSKLSYFCIDNGYVKRRLVDRILIYTCCEGEAVKLCTGAWSINRD